MQVLIFNCKLNNYLCRSQFDGFWLRGLCVVKKILCMLWLASVPWDSPNRFIPSSRSCRRCFCCPLSHIHAFVAGSLLRMHTLSVLSCVRAHTPTRTTKRCMKRTFLWSKYGHGLCLTLHIWGFWRLFSLKAMGLSVLHSIIYYA